MRFLDSNIFVYHMAADPDYGLRAGEILQRVEEGEEAATSTLIITQTSSYLKWKRASEKIPLFIALLQSLARLLKDETRLEDFTYAMKLAEEEKIPLRLWDDLVIASQMKRLGLKEIYSNDSDFDRIPGIRRLF